MITIAVVEECPYSVVGRGVMKLSHSVLSTLAGAVHDDIEWLALLIGKRSENGLEVIVDDLSVPLQHRSHASCSLVNDEPLGPEVVGVVHSHHSMGAFFSAVDDTTLNTRFPVSIVVSQNRANSSDAAKLLGFDYKVEGRAPLPCGTIGIMSFEAIPEPMIEGWPVKPTTGFGEPSTTTTLYHCPHTERKREGFVSHCSTKCGITQTENATAIFGRDGKKFLKEVRQSTRGWKGYQGSNEGRNGNQQYPIVVDNRRYFDSDRYVYGRQVDSEDAFLRHWSEGREY